MFILIGEILLLSIDKNYNIEVCSYGSAQLDLELVNIVKKIFQDYQRNLYGGFSIIVIYAIKDFFMKIKNSLRSKIRKI